MEWTQTFAFFSGHQDVPSTMFDWFAAPASKKDEELDLTGYEEHADANKAGNVAALMKEAEFVDADNDGVDDNFEAWVEETRAGTVSRSKYAKYLVAEQNRQAAAQLKRQAEEKEALRQAMTSKFQAAAKVRDGSNGTRPSCPCARNLLSLPLASIVPAHHGMLSQPPFPSCECLSFDVGARTMFCRKMWQNLACSELERSRWSAGIRRRWRSAEVQPRRPCWLRSKRWQINKRRCPRSMCNVRARGRFSRSPSWATHHFSHELFVLACPSSHACAVAEELGKQQRERLMAQREESLKEANEAARALKLEGREKVAAKLAQEQADLEAKQRKAQAIREQTRPEGTRKNESPHL